MEYNSSDAWLWAANFDVCNVFRLNGSKKLGLSIRCIKDKSTTVNNPVNPGELIVYPDPETDKLYLINIRNEIGKVLIYDLQGKQVLLSQISSDNIDISNLQSGIYILKLVYSENILIKKLIKA
jgi:hypothetical protein